MTTEKLSASLEDYLEAIFHIVEEKQAARAKDIAERLHVSGASVTGALRALARRELVNHEPYDIITLTREGETAARGVVSRHDTLKAFFVSVLGISEDEAEESACKMEHAVPESVLKRLIQYMESSSVNVRWDHDKQRFIQE